MALFNQKKASTQETVKLVAVAEVNTTQSPAVHTPSMEVVNESQFDTTQSGGSAATDATQAPVDAVTDVKLTGLQKAQARIAEMRASGEFNVVRLDPVEKAKANPKSLRAAITAHCFTCCGGGADPGVRQSVRDCKVTTCSLHVLRPWQNVLGKSADQMTEEELEDNSGKTEDLIDETEE